jgi:hypothetical protein
MAPTVHLRQGYLSPGFCPTVLNTIDLTLGYFLFFTHYSPSFLHDFKLD